MAAKNPESGAPDPAQAARKKNLDLALQQIAKDYGEGAIMRLGDEVAPVEVIPTGNILIDRALGDSRSSRFKASPINATAHRASKIFSGLSESTGSSRYRSSAPSRSRRTNSAPPPRLRQRARSASSERYFCREASKKDRNLPLDLSTRLKVLCSTR